MTDPAYGRIFGQIMQKFPKADARMVNDILRLAWDQRRLDVDTLALYMHQARTSNDEPIYDMDEARRRARIILDRVAGLNASESPPTDDPLSPERLMARWVRHRAMQPEGHACMPGSCADHIIGMLNAPSITDPNAPEYAYSEDWPYDRLPTPTEQLRLKRCPVCNIESPDGRFHTSEHLEAMEDGNA